MIRTFTDDTAEYDIEEYCAYCYNAIGIVADEGEYETVCPLCGNRLMLCTYCHDDFGDICDWDRNGDGRCSKCRT